MRILLAEDEEQLARVLKMAMEQSNYQVDAVGDGQKAVELSNKNAYDVIILDIMMPVKDGLEALKEIRARGDRTYIMMLTAMTEEDDRVNGLDLGADDYLTKPFSLKELLARLRSLERRTKEYSDEKLQFADLHLVWTTDDEADTEEVWINICYLRQKLQSIQSKAKIVGEKGGPYRLAG